MTELISYFSRSWPKTNHSGPAIIWQPGMAHDAIPSTAGPGGAPGDPRGSVRGPCGHIMQICSLHYPKKFPNGRVQLFKLRQTGLCSLSLSLFNSLHQKHFPSLLRSNYSPSIPLSRSLPCLCAITIYLLLLLLVSRDKKFGICLWSGLVDLWHTFISSVCW